MKLKKKTETFIYSGIEWRAHNYLNITKDKKDSIIEILEALDEDDDVQNTFINCEFTSKKI